MSVLRWLTMASMAIAVLPVLRSPMMSSRWPRPMGTIASTASRPVWTGSHTGWRSMMPGALNSMGRRWVVLMGPRPSIGWPSGFTTRPSIACPTGMSMTRPVVRHSSPSLMSSTSPKRTAPTSSRSRFWARPKTSRPVRELVNWRSSPAMAVLRPETCAMPSPTSVTTEASWRSTVALMEASSLRRVSMIFCELMESVTSPHLQ